MSEDFDNLDDALADWKSRRPPKDVVPKTPVPEDAPPIPTGPQTIEHYDWDDDGPTKTTEQVFIASPVMPKKEGNE